MVKCGVVVVVVGSWLDEKTREEELKQAGETVVAADPSRRG